MAYQNVGTPVFYIDNYIYLRALGLNPRTYISETDMWSYEDTPEHQSVLGNPEAFTLSPQIARNFLGGADGEFTIVIPCGSKFRELEFSTSGNMTLYCALLNHNLGDKDLRISYQFYTDSASAENQNDASSGVPILNKDTSMENGSTIFHTANSAGTLGDYIGINISHSDYLNTNPMPSDINIGAFSAGVRYKMPHSPELDLVMKITHDGLDKTTTLGGSVLSNIRYVGTPVWGNGDKFVAPFGVGGTSENNYLDGAIRNGRREWELTFMHIGDSDLFSSNYSSGSYFEYGATGYDSDDIDNQNQFEYNMFNDNSFI